MSISADRCRTARHSIVILCLFGGLLLADGRFGPISFPLRRMSAAVLIAVAGCTIRPRGWRLAGGLIATAGVALAPTTACALLAAVVAVAVLASGLSRLDLLGAPQACFTYVGLGFLAELLPHARLLNDFITAVSADYLRLGLGRDCRLSPTALGGPAIVLSVVFLIWRWRFTPSPLRLLAAVLIPVGWFLLLPVAQFGATDPVAIFVRGAIYGFLWTALAVTVDAAVSGGAAVGIADERNLRRGPLAWSSVASLIIGAMVVGVISPSSPVNRSLLVHNRGGLDWDRPVFGKFGAFSGGMFGLFPVYARANGYRFEVLDKDLVEPGDLAGFQILVLINSPKQWEGDELKTVRDFVAAGGNLLVLGDHTDVFGLMSGFNSLLQGFGITFRFDSAYHSRTTWRGCVAASDDALACGWDANGPGVAVGASLKLEGWARPLLTGRYAHSDIGLRENVLGSQLGNYSYDEGESLGDVVLAATVTHGRGRVLVLGDTTPFQGSFEYSFPLTVGPILNLLSRPIQYHERPLARILAVCLLIGVLSFSWAGRHDAISVAVMTSALLLGVGVGLAASRLQLADEIAGGPDLALIDRSHLPAVGHYAARVNPSSPLNLNLLRCGLRVANFDHWDREVLMHSRCIAFVAPRRSFTPNEVAELIRFEAEGGVLILAVGHPEASPSRPLLAAHDLDIEPRPLGTIPSATAGGARKEQEMPRFLDAWPIIDSKGGDLATSREIEVLYRFEGDVTALFRRHGRGGILLISDSRFFSSMNIEDVSDHSVGNLAFLHDVFQRHLSVEPSRVRPLFNSPTKPR